MWFLFLRTNTIRPKWHHTSYQETAKVSATASPMRAEMMKAAILMAKTSQKKDGIDSICTMYGTFTIIYLHFGDY